jgi:hypothetical protein
VVVDNLGTAGQLNQGKYRVEGRPFKANPAHDLYYEEVGEYNLDTTAILLLLFYLCIGLRLIMAR